MNWEHGLAFLVLILGGAVVLTAVLMALRSKGGPE